MLDITSNKDKIETKFIGFFYGKPDMSDKYIAASNMMRGRFFATTRITANQVPLILNLKRESDGRVIEISIKEKGLPNKFMPIADIVIAERSEILPEKAVVFEPDETGAAYDNESPIDSELFEPAKNCLFY